MKWRDRAEPVRMQRVAIVGLTAAFRQALAAVAESGSVELDLPERGSHAAAGPAHRALETLQPSTPVDPRLSRTMPDLSELARTGRADLLAGEASLENVATSAVARGDVSAIVGWAPVGSLGDLRQRLAAESCAVYALPPPSGVDPPTLRLTRGRVRHSFAPLVDTYATIPYADVDPTLLAGAAYVFMFGMMFGDVGHGALLVLAALLLRLGRPHWAAAARRVWAVVAAAGLAGIVFGFLYGECFGPTGLVPVIWLRPLEHPVTLLGVALGVGAVLLSGAYAVGIVNRWREGGWALALVSSAGMAGAALFLGAGVLVLAVVAHIPWLAAAGGAVAATGLVLAFVGFLAAAGGGVAGVTQASVELFDTALRLGTNVVSFARLAAFGLTHAALGLVVWQLTVALWGAGGLLMFVAVLAFVVGNAIAFALEALIAGVQALRLSYYELFSRVFTGEGRVFRPWYLPVEGVAVTPSQSPRDLRQKAGAGS